MKVQDEIVSILNSDSDKVYVYVAKESKNLDAVRQYAMENCDFSKAKAKVVLVFPLGLGQILSEVDGVYVDADSTTEDFLKKNLKVRDSGFIKQVNPETLEIL